MLTTKSRLTWLSCPNGKITKQIKKSLSTDSMNFHHLQFTPNGIPATPKTLAQPTHVDLKRKGIQTQLVFSHNGRN